MSNFNAICQLVKMKALGYRLSFHAAILKLWKFQEKSGLHTCGTPLESVFSPKRLKFISAERNSGELLRKAGYWIRLPAYFCGGHLSSRGKDRSLTLSDGEPMTKEQSAEKCSLHVKCTWLRRRLLAAPTCGNNVHWDAKCNPENAGRPGRAVPVGSLGM